MLKISRRNTIFLLFLILVISIFFRFYKLNEIPSALHVDVAINGFNAFDVIESGNFKVFYPDNNGREGLFINLIALSFLIFSPSVLAIKGLAALFGVFTVFGVYLLTRQLFKYIGKEEKINLNILVRQEKNSSSEIEYLIAVCSKIVPIEVKAGTIGKLKSLKIFQTEKNIPLGLRISQAPLSFNNGVLSLPFYFL